MMRQFSAIVLVLTVTTFVVVTLQRDGGTSEPHTPLSQRALSFELNEGQLPAETRFVARGRGYTVELGEAGARLTLSQLTHRPALTAATAVTAPIDIQFPGSRHSALVPQNKLPGVTHYYRGSDPTKWIRNVSNYGQVTQHGLYPGIDLVYYGSAKSLEFDFVVAPRANPAAIRMKFAGADKTTIDSDGSLRITSGGLEAHQKPPFVYQEHEGVRTPIPCRYVLHPETEEVSFALGSYDTNSPLIIDPVLQYANYIGGSGNELAEALVVAPDGAIVIAGFTDSPIFPGSSTSIRGMDAFVTKVSSTGVILSTVILGGTGDEFGRRVSLQSDGSIFVSGWTSSPNFPTTPGAIQRNYGGGSQDAFLAKLSPFGELVYSTFLGGSGSDEASGLAVDSAGNAYLSGTTDSPNFPTTPGVLRRNGGGIDGFVAKLSVAPNTSNPTSSLIYSTYLGGSSTDYANKLAIDSSGNVYVTGDTHSDDFPLVNPIQSTRSGGFDAYVAKLNPTGTALIFSTFLGGDQEEQGWGINLDPGGNVAVAGLTYSANFPTASPFQARQGGSQDAYAAKLSADGRSLIYSTFLGGAGDDWAFDLVSDAVGNTYISGISNSNNFPTANATQPINRGDQDAFIVKLSPNGRTLLFSTYFGGVNFDKAASLGLDGRGDIYFSGQSSPSADFPSTNSAPLASFGGGVADAYVAKLASANLRLTQTGLRRAIQDGVNEIVINAQILNQNAVAGLSSCPNCVPADNVGVTAALPSTLQLVSCVADTGASCMQSGNNIGGTLSTTLGLTRTVNVTIRATVQPGTPVGTVIPVSLRARSDTNDPDESDNVAVYNFTVTDPNVSCSYTLNRASTQAPAGGGSDSLTVTAPAGCVWTAGVSASWITIQSGANGTGSGTVNFSITANTTGGSRTGTITVAGQSFTITQPSLTTGSQGLGFHPVTPCRAVDTRLTPGELGGPRIGGGSTRSFPIPRSVCGIPTAAQAYSLNITVVPSSTLGYLSVWPTGQAQPLVSTLNSFDGRIKANAAIVPAGSNGAVSIYVTHDSEVIIDINGYFSPGTADNGLAFYPITPCRVVDTRNGAGLFGGPSLAGGSSTSFPIRQSNCGIPSYAQAYSLNMTVVPLATLGYLTTWPVGASLPLVSTLNAQTGAITANAAVVPAGINGGISVYVTHPTNLIIDANGYFAPPGAPGALLFYPVSPCRIADTRLATGAFGGPSLGGGQVRSFNIPSGPCAVPASARAYSLNATVVPPGYLSYLTLWPAGVTQPLVSTLNALDGSVVANAAIVPASSAGSINAFVSEATHILLDMNGYFAP